MIITDPSHAQRSSFNNMNMEGVEERAVKTASAPVLTIPRTTLSERSAAERRESCPTATRIFSLPVRFFINVQKAAARFSAASAVRLTSSPGTPSVATPLTSVPFFSCRYSCKVIINK